MKTLPIIELMGRMKNLYGPPPRLKTEEAMNQTLAEYTRLLEAFSPSMDEVEHAWTLITETHKGASWPPPAVIMGPLRAFRARVKAKERPAKLYGTGQDATRRREPETAADRRRYAELGDALQKCADGSCGDLQLILFQLHKESGKLNGLDDAAVWEFARPTVAFARQFRDLMTQVDKRRHLFAEAEPEPEIEGFV